MTLETEAGTVATDAALMAKTAAADTIKVAEAVVKTGILTKLKTGIVSAIKFVPNLFLDAGSLLTGSSMLIKGGMIAMIMFIPVGTYMKGRHDATKACIAHAAKAHAKNVKAYAKLKKHNSKMGKSSVDSSLSKWVQ
ncbi:MAG TPA: hypothetical protein VNZ45_03040 [Bacteroidia bacterium]|jgi:hypothetical protein|nr:hypothetical protein [Bacteroidia bacterium]